MSPPTREQRPTLLQGPGKSADLHGEQEIPKLRFARQQAAEEVGCAAPIAASGAGSFEADGEVLAGLRPSEILRLQEVAKHYKMGKQIGEGGYGKVYKVQCKKTRKKFALKEVVIPQDQNVDDLETEVVNSSEFDHPYILKLHGYFKDDRTYHLVFDLCTGGNLAEYVEEYVQACREYLPDWKAGLPGQSVMMMVPQMLSGLLYLHHHGFMHRDIKPHNYLRMTKSCDTLKLCDFGMCVRLQPEEKLSKTCGTRGFMAPEVQWGSYDQKADVFSLGITIFSVCTDQVPQDEQNEDRYCARIQNTLLNERKWQEENPQLGHLVCRMLALCPEYRPTVKELMADTEWVTKALDKLQKKQPTCAAPCSVM